MKLPLLMFGFLLLIHSFWGGHQVAFADYQNAVLVEGPTPTAFSVTGNSVHYTQLSPQQDMQAKVLIKAHAGVAGRVTEVNAYLVLKNQDFQTSVLSGQLWGYHKNYANIRKRTIDSTVAVRIPARELQQWLATQCNTLVDRLKRNGMSDREIWAQDRTINILATYQYGVGFTAPRGANATEVPPASGSGQISSNVRLTCKKFAGAQGPGVGGVGSQARIDRVESAILQHAVVAGHSGVCRLKLDYAVRTNHKNVAVKFRLKDDKGRSSEIKTLTTNDLKIAVGNVSYNIPNNVGAEIGKIRMHGISPEFVSNQIEYRVVCHTPPAKGLTTGSGSGGQSTQQGTINRQQLLEQIQGHPASQGLQGIGGRVRSRGMDALPPPIIPDPEPPALPKN